VLKILPWLIIAGLVYWIYTQNQGQISAGAAYANVDVQLQKTALSVGSLIGAFKTAINAPTQ